MRVSKRAGHHGYARRGGVAERAWGQVIDLWDVLTEEERKEVMNGLVQEVIVTEKDRVHLRPSPIASVHGQFIAINSRMGAGRGLCQELRALAI